jgi:hypothetical protein
VTPAIIGILFAVVFFGILALGLLWISDKYFPEYPIVRWICGAFLIVLILLYASGQLHLPYLHIP